MPLEAKLHEVIDRYNVLKEPTRKMSQFLLNHPTLYKVALLANHLFRAAGMFAFMVILPFSPLAATSICLAGSFFYRLTVENNCAYKFAIPSFAGAVAWATGSWLLVTAYVTYIVLTVSYDVNARCAVIN